MQLAIYSLVLVAIFIIIARRDGLFGVTITAIGCILFLLMEHFEWNFYLTLAAYTAVAVSMHAWRKRDLPFNKQ